MAKIVRLAAIFVRLVRKVVRLAISLSGVINLSAINRREISHSEAGMTGRPVVTMFVCHVDLQAIRNHPAAMTDLHDALMAIHVRLGVTNLGAISLVVTSPMLVDLRAVPVEIVLIEVVTDLNHAATDNVLVAGASSQEVIDLSEINHAVAVGSNPVVAVLGGIANPCVLLRVG
jgi:hypothetical protein